MNGGVCVLVFFFVWERREWKYGGSIKWLNDAFWWLWAMIAGGQLSSPYCRFRSISDSIRSPFSIFEPSRNENVIWGHLIIQSYPLFLLFLHFLFVNNNHKQPQQHKCMSLLARLRCSVCLSSIVESNALEHESIVVASFSFCVGARCARFVHAMLVKLATIWRRSTLLLLLAVVGRD